MGIAKAKGMALAKRKKGAGGGVFVLTGDGELQEGQNYESLQHAVNRGIGNFTIIVDHNKVQSDKPLDVISSLGDIEAKIRAFGWQVRRINGHDFAQLASALKDPQPFTIVLADTIKGKGVSFMENDPSWHGKAPNPEQVAQALSEIGE